MGDESVRDGGGYRGPSRRGVSPRGARAGRHRAGRPASPAAPVHRLDRSTPRSAFRCLVSPALPPRKDGRIENQNTPKAHDLRQACGQPIQRMAADLRGTACGSFWKAAPLHRTPPTVIPSLNEENPAAAVTASRSETAISHWYYDRTRLWPFVQILFYNFLPFRHPPVDTD